MMQKPPMMPAEIPPFWAVYFAVEDTDTAVARVAELGGTVLMAPMDIEPGRFSTVSDPFGAVFNVIALEVRARRLLTTMPGCVTRGRYTDSGDATSMRGE